MHLLRLHAARPPAATLLAVAALCSAAVCGCYNGEAMVDRALQRVADDHLAEIDLGSYQVTLPRHDGDAVATTVRLDLVATVERRHARAVEHERTAVETRLRHATLMSLRRCSRAELLEPDLSGLRKRIRTATEQYLTAAPIEAIVFRSFAVHED